MTSYHGWTHAPKEMGGTDPIPGTGAVYHFVVFEDTAAVTSGDGKFIFHIPADLDGMALGDIEINVETVSSSGIVQVQLHNITDAVDMLSTRVQVDANEYHSRTASTAAVINTANATVAHGDRIRVDVDAAGTGALGLDVVLRFYTTAGFTLRGPTGSVGATGATGETGAPLTPRGAWAASVAYVVGDFVSNGGATYAAIADHTSDTDDDEPGVGANWEDYWMEVAPSTGSDDGWIQSASWTYATAATFTISGDYTATFTPGTRVKLTQTSAKYFVVVASSFGGGTTTVTITGGTDYTLANAAIDAPYYSYSANPQGYPGWFSYTPALEATTTNPTLGSGSTQAGFFAIEGRVVSLLVDIRFGTSGTNAGSGTYQITLPVSSRSTGPGIQVWGLCELFDASGTPQIASVRGGTSSSVMQFRAHGGGGNVAHATPWAWTTSDRIAVSATYAL